MVISAAKQTLLFFFLSFCITAAQDSAPIWLSEVVNVSWGEGEFESQSSQFFPNNLNRPTTTATRFIPSTSPDDVVSLGLGGSITLTIGGEWCVNKPGTDFIVFENAFEIQGLGRLFIEPAQVSVSRDGLEWIDFPFDSVTLVGCSGTKPTIGAAIETDILQAGGTHFDLESIGVDSIRFIRLQDVSGIIKTPGHPLYDPIVDGSELDAIAVLNSESYSANSILTDDIQAVSLHHRSIQNTYHEDIQIRVFNALGKRQFSATVPVGTSTQVPAFVTGMVFVMICDVQQQVTHTFQVYLPTP